MKNSKTKKIIVDISLWRLQIIMPQNDMKTREKKWSMNLSTPVYQQKYHREKERRFRDEEKRPWESRLNKD